jgi:hypothetical protein
MAGPVGALSSARLDVDALLADRQIRIIVCCGSGGVGKTTTAAALALRAAEEHGRRTVVLTIDPAAGSPSRWACPSWTTLPVRSRASGRAAANCTP